MRVLRVSASRIPQNVTLTFLARRMKMTLKTLTTLTTCNPKIFPEVFL